MLTIYDIMGTDHVLYAKDKENEIEVLIINEDTDKIEYRESTHKFAWDSLVYFAKQVISENERIEKQMELKSA